MPEHSLSFAQIQPCRFSTSLYSQALLAAGKLTQFLPISVLSFDWFQFLSVCWYIPAMPNAAEQVTVESVLAVKTRNCISFCLSRASVERDLSTCFSRGAARLLLVSALPEFKWQRSPLAIHLYFAMQNFFFWGGKVCLLQWKKKPNPNHQKIQLRNNGKNISLEEFRKTWINKMGGRCGS